MGLRQEFRAAACILAIRESSCVGSTYGPTHGAQGHRHAQRRSAHLITTASAHHSCDVFLLYSNLFYEDAGLLSFASIFFSVESPRFASAVQAAEPATPHDDYGPQLNRTIWLLVALSALFLGLRIYCKLWRRRLLWWDDYFLVASWVRPEYALRWGVCVC